jgi:hypothetical protein
MSTSKHTPGPWRWYTSDTLIGDHGRRPVVLMPGNSPAASLRACGPDGRLQTFTKDCPDACLIAAAPEMLEALKLAASGAHDWESYAEAAIAKAEGRAC